jgi:hypothetical protein
MLLIYPILIPPLSSLQTLATFRKRGIEIEGDISLSLWPVTIVKH